MINLETNGDLLYESPGKAYIIYKAWINDESVVVIEHTPSGQKVLIDDTEKIYNQLIKECKRSRILFEMKHGNTPMWRLLSAKNRKHVSLVSFLYSKYNNTTLEAARRSRIILHDRSLVEDKILDYRKDNIYNLSHMTKNNLQVVSRPNNEEEKYIVMEYHGYYEIHEYSDMLFDLLGNNQVCTFSFNHSMRMGITLNCDRWANGGVRINFSRLAMILDRYNVNFKSNKRKITMFRKAFPSFLEEKKDYDASHVYPNKWNSCKNNLIWMSKKANQSMGKIVSQFIGNYNAYPISIHDGDKDIIIMEFTENGRTHYLRFDSPEQYCSFQLSIFGKDKVTKKVRLYQAFVNDDVGLVANIKTPLQEYKEKKEQAKQPDRESILSSFWNWCDKRDELIKHFYEAPNDFKLWVDTREKNSPYEWLANFISLFGSGAGSAIRITKVETQEGTKK